MTHQNVLPPPVRDAYAILDDLRGQRFPNSYRVGNLALELVDAVFYALESGEIEEAADYPGTYALRHKAAQHFHRVRRLAYEQRSNFDEGMGYVKNAEDATALRGVTV